MTDLWLASREIGQDHIVEGAGTVEVSSESFEVTTSSSEKMKEVQVGEGEVIFDSSEDDYPAPTEEESTTLRKVAGSMPLVSFSLCLVELAERASYYGAYTVYSNFVEFPLPKGMFTVRLLACCNN